MRVQDPCEDDDEAQISAREFRCGGFSSDSASFYFVISFFVTSGPTRISGLPRELSIALSFDCRMSETRADLLNRKNVIKSYYKLLKASRKSKPEVDKYPTLWIEYFNITRITLLRIHQIFAKFEQVELEWTSHLPLTGCHSAV